VPRRRSSLTERDRLIEDVVYAIPGPVATLIVETLMLPPSDRAAAIGRLYEHPKTRSPSS
jgi:hypothetical protein